MLGRILFRQARNRSRAPMTSGFSKHELYREWLAQREKARQGERLFRVIASMAMAPAVGHVEAAVWMR
jgi:hypothetical protein